MICGNADYDNVILNFHLGESNLDTQTVFARSSGLVEQRVDGSHALRISSDVITLITVSKGECLKAMLKHWSIILPSEPLKTVLAFFVFQSVPSRAAPNGFQ